MTINIKALDNALAHIDAHPDEWDQSTWICGTHACIAGRIVLQYDVLETDDRHISTIALEILGLEGEYTHPLFWSGNTRDALTVWRTVLAGGRVILPGANLRNADLSGADLGDADLFGADLRGAKLFGADLRGADLSAAVMKGAILTGADFRGADLRYTDLSGVNLENADFTDVDFSETIR